MRRDYFTIEARGLEGVEDGGEPEQPAVIIDFEGPASLLQDRIAGPSAELLDDSEIDVSFRYRTQLDDPDARGVLSLTNRVTGDYVLELNTEAELIRDFVRAAGEYGKHVGNDEDRYRVEVRVDGDRAVTYTKRTFLLYNRDGNLLRNDSLIPSGVEL